ncbi:hypothetical protein GCM10010406_41820 [Streptomyces thermolineatus]|uniref:Uncharacterized protein n=1 Tax=Streptomyces thermolineatus TaxID=44033 RepID=A0ABP5ZP47_9ACTN
MDPLNTTQSGLPESEAAAEARRLLDEWAGKPVRHHPTSFRDDTEPPAFGTAPPVKQEDHRIVPAWAAGIAVASIGTSADHGHLLAGPDPHHRHRGRQRAGCLRDPYEADAVALLDTAVAGASA